MRGPGTSVAFRSRNKEPRNPGTQEARKEGAFASVGALDLESRCGGIEEESVVTIDSPEVGTDNDEVDARERDELQPPGR